MAKRPDGAVLVQYGDSVVLVPPSAASRSARDRFSSAHLRLYGTAGASGRIPGGYFKRKGARRDGDAHSRLIDRPHAPLFPKGWRCETQIIALVLSADQKNPTDVHAMTAFVRLHISDVPWGGPYVGVRVGRVEGQFVINRPFSSMS